MRVTSSGELGRTWTLSSSEPLTPAAAAELLARPEVEQVERLEYSNSTSPAAGFIALLSSPRWCALRQLRLSLHLGFDDEALATLLDNPVLADLELLDLLGSDISDAGVADLSTRGLPGLCELTLSAGLAGVRALAASSALPSLRRLTLTAAAEEVVAQALASLEVGAFAQLEQLRFTGAMLSGARATQLMARLTARTRERIQTTALRVGRNGAAPSAELLALLGSETPTAAGWRRVRMLLDQTSSAHLGRVHAALSAPAWQRVPRPAEPHWVESAHHRPGQPVRTARGNVPTPSSWLAVATELELSSLELLPWLRPFVDPASLRVLRHRGPFDGPGGTGAFLPYWRERFDDDAHRFLAELTGLEVLELAAIDDVHSLDLPLLSLGALRELHLINVRPDWPLLDALSRGPWTGLHTLALPALHGASGLPGDLAMCEQLARRSTIKELQLLDLRGAIFSGRDLPVGTGDAYDYPPPATSSELEAALRQRWPSVVVRL